MTQLGGQLLLIVILLFFLLYILRLRTVLLERVLYIVIAIAGISLVIDPEFTSNVAHRLGIGRGTDLLFYFFILAAMFFAVTVSTRIRELQRQVSQLVSALAAANPEHGPVPGPATLDQARGHARGWPRRWRLPAG